MNICGKILFLFVLLAFGSTQAAELGSVSNRLTLKSVLVKTEPLRNYVNLEMGGRGGLYSLNLERRLSRNMTIGAGFSHYSFEVKPTVATVGASLSIFPIYTNFYFNNSKLNYFVTTGVSIAFLEANADVSLKDVLGNLQFDINSQNNEKFSVSSNSDMAAKNKTKIIMPLPSIGFGAEYRASGALLRLSTYSFYLDQFYHWAGLSIGGGF